MRTFRRLCFAAVLTAAFTIPALADGGITQAPGFASPGQTDTPPCMVPGETQTPPCTDPGDIQTLGFAAPGEMGGPTSAFVMFALRELWF